MNNDYEINRNLQQDDSHEIPVPGVQEVEIKRVKNNPEKGNPEEVISEIERQEEGEKVRQEEIERIKEKRDRTIH
jgi:hypothetical protein